MRTMGWNVWRQRAGFALGASALLVTYGCGGSGANGVSAASAPVPGSMPVVVGCEPHQRTLVRQAVVNGAAVSQVECVAVAPVEQAQPAQVPAHYAAAVQPAATYAPLPATQPVSAPAVLAPATVRQPVYDDLENARVVRTSSAPVRPVRTNQVIYEDRPPAKRSAAKSAVIIGSSAGAGAGVGAAIGGKKGALIGAAIGGGGAAVWDQVTRRK